MGDDATTQLLQEIRDLQKQQLELLRTSAANQQQSLANQMASLAVQKEAHERQKLLVGRANRLWIFALGAVFLVSFLIFFSTLMSTCMRLFLHR